MIPAVSWVPKRVVRFVRKAADPPFKKTVKNGALETSEEDVQTMDPYLKDKDNDALPEELEDLTIHPKDTIIACVRNKHGLCHLEVSILEDLGYGDSNLYVHHDVVLSAHALCAVRLGRPLTGGKEGNFIAVGSFLSSIEIWDLDIVDEMQPTLVLGRNYKNSTENVEGGHSGSVFGLSWNYRLRYALASASADKLVKIWDVCTGECDITMEHHTQSVKSVAWSPHGPLLLSGSSDRSVVMRDPMRTQFPGWNWAVGAEVQSVAWDPYGDYSFVVALKDGTVQGFDLRSSEPVFTIHAHDEAVISVLYNFCVPNLLATGSEDNTVKLWDLSNNQPRCIASHNPNAGGVLSISFSGDNPFLLAIGGSKGELKVWDTSLYVGMATISAGSRWY